MKEYFSILITILSITHALNVFFSFFVQCSLNL